MVNSFKFGFLALAMTVAFASCGGGASQTKSEEAVEATTEVEATEEATAEVLENATDSTAVVTEEPAENVQ